jgi:transmembrane sensor
MTPSNEQIRAAIADQANEWFVENRAAPLDREAAARFIAWLKTSPMHIEEYLVTVALAADLKTVANATQISLELLLARARTGADNVVTLDQPLPGELPIVPRKRWSAVRSLAASAVLGVVAITALWVTQNGIWLKLPAATVEHYATIHGELKTRHLSDGSTLHLNTDTRVTVRYSGAERLVELEQGEALFEVVPHPTRPFRVVALTTSVVAVGTAFALRQERGSTLVTVLRGRVAVQTTGSRGPPIQVNEGYAVRAFAGQPLGSVAPADLSRATAWLQRQIIFDRESLAAVAAEFNRYAAVPIEIETPALRSLSVSGVFSVDDTETFLDFLRSLEGVSVTSTAIRVRVFQSAANSHTSSPDRH